MMMQKILSKLAQIKSAQEDRPKQYRLSFGEQDPMDIISYAGMEEADDYFLIDGRFCRVLTISAYPYNAESGWLDRLINFGHNIDISYHVEEIDRLTAINSLTKKVTNLEAIFQEKADKNKIMSAKFLDQRSTGNDLLDRLQRGQTKLFQMSVYIALNCRSLDELNTTTKLLVTTLAEKMFFTKPVLYNQLAALQSVLPRGENVLQQQRNMDTKTVALTFPFVSSELVQESGVLYGINKSNNSLVIVDRFSLQNANSIVFAQSGSGKSYAMKVEILRQLMQGTSVIVIDPEREYKDLAKSVQGTYVHLAIGAKNYINPFDLASASHSKDNLNDHVQFLKELISVMVSGSSSDSILTSKEEAALDKAILKVYKENDDLTGPPLLSNLYEKLKDAGQKDLCESLEKYIYGSVPDIFNSTTNVKLDNRLIVFDIKDMPETERKVMMMVISNFVQNTVKAKPRKRLLVIDEGWILLQHEQSARFISGLVRRARKYYLGVAFITQQATDFLNSEHGRAIASQASFRVLMHQDTTSIKRVAMEFGLSEYEEKYLKRCGRGEALLIADQHHVAVTVVASEKEHPLITTDPQEIYKQ